MPREASILLQINSIHFKFCQVHLSEVILLQATETQSDVSSKDDLLCHVNGESGGRDILRHVSAVFSLSVLSC